MFGRERSAWGHRIAVLVFGHAVLELALQPDRLLVAKAIALVTSPDKVEAAARQPVSTREFVDVHVAALIEAEHRLRDPQELRPLPLSGVPGWNAASLDERFFAEAPCFRPLRPGRRYPPPDCA